MGDIIFAYAGQSVYPTVQHDMRNPEDFTTSVLLGYAGEEIYPGGGGEHSHIKTYGGVPL